MGHYKSNLRDLEFNLFEVFGADKALGRGPFAQMDVDTARDVLARWSGCAPRTSPSPSPTPTATRRSSTRRPTR